jgi:transcriptional regulator with XRE-family HTH domain
MDRSASTLSSSGPCIGGLLREWRLRRRRSQLDLALDAGVSTRHLSCIETGRARPGAETLLALAQCLEVPLRERNDLLLAAGFAPRFPHRELGTVEMARVRGALEQLLAAHDPMPGLVLDRQWNVVMANTGAAALVQLLPTHLAGPPLNVFRASLHPQGLARLTGNLVEWGAVLVSALRRAVQRTADPVLAALLAEVLAYPTVEAIAAAAGKTAGEPLPLLVPCILDLPAGRVSLFTTLTTFGTPRDVTLEELCVELFYPADEASASLWRRLSGPATTGTAKGEMP